MVNYITNILDNENFTPENHDTLEGKITNLIEHTDLLKDTYFFDFLIGKIALLSDKLEEAYVKYEIRIENSNDDEWDETSEAFRLRTNVEWLTLFIDSFADIIQHAPVYVAIKKYLLIEELNGRLSFYDISGLNLLAAKATDEKTCTEYFNLTLQKLEGYLQSQDTSKSIAATSESGIYLVNLIDEVGIASYRLGHFYQEKYQMKLVLDKLGLAYNQIKKGIGCFDNNSYFYTVVLSRFIDTYAESEIENSYEKILSIFRDFPNHSSYVQVANTETYRTFLLKKVPEIIALNLPEIIEDIHSLLYRFSLGHHYVVKYLKSLFAVYENLLSENKDIVEKLGKIKFLPDSLNENDALNDREKAFIKSDRKFRDILVDEYAKKMFFDLLYGSELISHVYIERYVMREVLSCNLALYSRQMWDYLTNYIKYPDNFLFGLTILNSIETTYCYTPKITPY